VSVLALEFIARIRASEWDTGQILFSGQQIPKELVGLVAHEEESIEIEVHVQSETDVSVWVGYERLPLVFEKQAPDVRILRYQWDVGYYAGDAHVFVVIGGTRIPMATVSVRPRRSKLADNQYQQILEELLARMHSFFTESSVYMRMGATFGGPRYYVVLAEQICGFWPQLVRALRQITENPKKRVEKTQHRNRLIQSRSSSLLVYRDYVLGRKALPDEANVAWETEWLWDERYRVTDNTFENAATAGFLRDLQTTIRQILLYFEKRPFHLETMLKRMYREVSGVLKTSPFRDVPVNGATPKPTLVFRKDPRYQTVYRCFQTFRKGVAPYRDLDLHIPLMETHVVYEYWCFFKVVDILERMQASKARLELCPQRIGGFLVFDPLASATAKVGPYVVYYQKAYSYSKISPPVGLYSISHQMIPDIVVERDGRRWLFDAKYRSGHVGLNEALDDMHKYRDAIRDTNGERAFREVYILCPNIIDQSMRQRYTSPEYMKKHGLGIIELRADYGQERLESVFKEPIETAFI
jgi:hypothetical protein